MPPLEEESPSPGTTNSTFLHIQERIHGIKTRIREKALQCGRSPDSVRLVSVGKKQTAPLVLHAAQAGANIIGENYIQEALDKIHDLEGAPISWHFIGHLQSNKAKQAVRHFELIHSVDSLKLALSLNREAEKIGKIQEVLIQVNLSEEMTKSGLERDAVIGLLQSIAPLPHLTIKGLMTMPAFFDDPEGARPFFKALRTLASRIEQKRIPRVQMRELSMGMTGDFEVAIEEGATLVRIGTAIFGER